MKQEHILVVKRETLLGTDAFQGLSKNVEPFLKTITQAQEFHPRHIMEDDLNYKQIIPYLLFKNADNYFLMQRQSSSSEQRLKNKYSLGIGGHMRQEDMQSGATIFDWARREFHEEIDYEGTLAISTLGILNDDSNAVGKVHCGLILLLEGDTNKISVRSELKSGQLLDAFECLTYYPDMESWSQIVFDEIIRPNISVPHSNAVQKTLQ